MCKKNLKYIVGIIVVIMVSVLALGGCKKNKDKEHYFYGCTNYNSGRGCLNVLNFDEVRCICFPWLL